MVQSPLSALTRSKQFLSTKPCQHGSSSFIHIPLGEGEKAVNVYSVVQLIKAKREVNWVNEQMLPSCGQREQSLNYQKASL